MHIDYDDIIERVAEAPLWWLDGVPRYRPFRPEDLDVYAKEVALVHTVCQGCGKRYDVGVMSKGMGQDLRGMIILESSVGSMDPPNACPSLEDGSICSGAYSTSYEIAVLEYWHKSGASDWQRDSSMERPLVDADEDETGKLMPPQPLLLCLQHSERGDDWADAECVGDYSAMVAMLTSAGCDRPRHVAHMLDVRRRYSTFLKHLGQLENERLRDCLDPENVR